MDASKRTIQDDEDAISKVHQPHDKFFKRLLSNPSTTKDILAGFLPKHILSVIDLNHLELQRDSFIDDEHRVFAVDLLFKTSFSREEGYLWVLIEHQSTEDKWMPLRVLKYIATIWDHLRKQGQKNLPFIYPLIIYNGVNPYNQSLTLKELIQPVACQDWLTDLFEQPISLIDLNAMKDETLRFRVKNHVAAFAFLLTLKHVFDKDLQPYFEETLVEYYKQMDEPGKRDDLADMIFYLFKQGNLQKDPFNAIINTFSNEVGDKCMTLAEQFFAEGECKGMLEEKLHTAERMLAGNFNMETIAQITGLNPSEIKKLQLKTH